MWRDDIENWMSEEMLSYGFQAKGPDTFSLPINDDADYVVSIKQSFRYRDSSFDKLFTIVGVIYKPLVSYEIAAIEGVHPFSPKGDIADVLYQHPIFEHWAAVRPLDDLFEHDTVIDKDSGRNGETISKTLHGVISVGLPYMRQFDHLSEILENLLLPPRQKKALCQSSELFIPLGHLILGEMEEAESYMSYLENKISAQRHGMNAQFYAKFTSEVRKEIGLRYKPTY